MKDERIWWFIDYGRWIFLGDSNKSQPHRNGTEKLLKKCVGCLLGLSRNDKERISVIFFLSFLTFKKEKES